MAQPTKRQLAKVRKAKFLAAFRRYKVVALAARRAGVPRQTIYDWTAADPVFKAALNNAQQEVMDMLELELHKLATGAYSRPIVSAGKLVTHDAHRRGACVGRCGRTQLHGDCPQVLAGGQ
jgi:hypothetical protein